MVDFSLDLLCSAFIAYFLAADFDVDARYFVAGESFLVRDSLAVCLVWRLSGEQDYVRALSRFLLYFTNGISNFININQQNILSFY